MRLKLILTASLLAWLLALFGYIHWTMRVARADERATPTFDRETATRRLRGAAIEGWTKTAAEAIRFGANVDETNEYGTTPLILAAIRGHDRIVKLLLDAGADPNRENDDRVSPMLGAAANCNDPVVTELLRQGANPNPRSRTRETPLMRAAENGCAVVVKILLGASGIDLRATDDSGRTALDYARESSVLGLDNGDSFALIDGRRRDVLARAGHPKKIRRPIGLPRGTRTPRSMPRAIPILD
jgi:ankyrin repeat protein